MPLLTIAVTQFDLMQSPKMRKELVSKANQLF